MFSLLLLGYSHNLFYTRELHSYNKLLAQTNQRLDAIDLKVTNVKKKISSGTSLLLIGGIAFFTLGLLVILRLDPVFWLFSQIIPDVQVIEVVGVTIQLLGQALVVFGTIHSTAHNLISNMQNERRITMEGFAQNNQQLQNKLLNEQQALKTGYAQVMAKIDALIASQKPVEIQSKTVIPSNCKFCGTRIEQGYFCPKCGKAN